MKKKAQVEFIVLIGLIFIVALVIYFAYQLIIMPSAIPPAIKAEQEMVEDSIINLIRKASDESIRVMETHGGYLVASSLDDPSASVLPEQVLFMQQGVPYWQKCQNDVSPSISDVTEWMETGIENYIQGHLEEVVDIYGKNVTYGLSQLSVNANILGNKIDVTVVLPTKVQGYPIPQPYTVSIPTKFGEIFSFAKDFSSAAASERFFEYFTINSIYFSKDLATQGVLTECGDSIYQTINMISNGLYDSIVYTLTHILWWQNMPSNAEAAKVYAIKDLNGKSYSQLTKIGLYLPDEFAIKTANPLSVANNKYVLKGFYTVPVCIAIYDWKYSVSYPLIIRVDDPLTGYSFNFASLVHVEEMQPGTCTGLTIIPQADKCENLGCYARIRVMDGNGDPVADASVSFGGCDAGRTGVDGYIEGDIKCGAQELVIYKRGHEFYAENISSSVIDGTYILNNVPTLETHFRDVGMSQHEVRGPEPYHQLELSYNKCSLGYITEMLIGNFNSTETGSAYPFSNIDLETSPSSDCFEQDACKECDSTHNIDKCRQCAQLCSGGVLSDGLIDYIPGGDYNVDAELLDLAGPRMRGGFKTGYTVPDNNSSLYIYVPRGVDASVISGLEKTQLTSRLREWCDMEPVATSEQLSTIKMTHGCSCSQLKTLISREFSDCAGTSIVSEGCNKNVVVNTIKNNCDYRILGCT